MYPAMAYMDGDFFIASSSCNNKDVYSVTGTKDRTIVYDRNCGKADNDKLVEMDKVRDIVVNDDHIKDYY